MTSAGGGGFLPDWYTHHSPTAVAILAACAVARSVVAPGSGGSGKGVDLKKSQ